MGTRSLTRVFDGAGKELVCMYRQMDGYPTGHGQEIADFLKPVKIVNGIGGSNAGKVLANGYGCLAAQLVAHFKVGTGGFYLYPAGSKDCGEEYEYHVKPALSVEHVGQFGPEGPPVIVAYDIRGGYAGKKRRLHKMYECTPAEFADVTTTYQALQMEEV